MNVNFDCIRSSIERENDNNIKVIGVTSSNSNGYSYYEYVVYNKIITFTIKLKSDTANNIDCIKYCDIIQKSDLDNELNKSPNLLKDKINNNIDKCIIKNNLNGCQFEKEECKKHIS
ncbi:hypothetical protein [Brachyspira hyodysenteriae]|uniref:hypothetical protein n=1 Tax=Brachyspira hyodysenteriae TaxID=159 RepID=UPI00063DA09A|nr:hypothetical protein [Brachyspira hyodysenteriae]KLI19486.1 hypothetical protein SU45_00335 [Brachyspira hyodysenteriae]KLI62481.1 hypothetical protein SZ46_01375 [Brachyspira hyodysenteriae]